MGTAEHVAEVEADAEVASSVAEAEALATVVEAGVEPEPAPVTIVEDHQGDEPEMPPAEHHEPRDHKTPSKKLLRILTHHGKTGVASPVYARVRV